MASETSPGGAKSNLECLLRVIKSSLGGTKQNILSPKAR